MEVTDRLRFGLRTNRTGVTQFVDKLVGVAVPPGPADVPARDWRY